MASTTPNRRPLVIGVIVVAVVVAVAVVVPWIYTTFISDPPDRLSLDDAPATGEPAEGATDPEPGAADDEGDGSLDGTWTVGEGSEAGYRVPEVLFGQETEAVGRTSDVTGELEVRGTTVESGSFTVDLTTVTSDEGRRDGQFQGRIMDTANHPTATFELTEPLELDGELPDGEVVAVSAPGELTARGNTAPVVASVEARRTGEVVEVSGSVPVVFSELGIPNPSIGPAVVGDEGEIEVLLVLTRS